MPNFLAGGGLLETVMYTRGPRYREDGPSCAKLSL